MFPKDALFFILLSVYTSKDGSSDATQITVQGNQLQQLQLPPGCTCFDPIRSSGGQSSADCMMFDCSCSCDLHPNRCDKDCCCDTDCSKYDLMEYQCSKDKERKESMLANMCFEKDFDQQILQPPYRKQIHGSIEVREK